MIVAQEIYQEIYFVSASGTARVAGSGALAECKRQRQAGERPSEASRRRKLNNIKHEQFPWEVTKNATQQTMTPGPRSRTSRL
jgi:putative transposase